jgi:hypothetical protein
MPNVAAVQERLGQPVIRGKNGTGTLPGGSKSALDRQDTLAVRDEPSGHRIPMSKRRPPKPAPRPG